MRLLDAVTEDGAGDTVLIRNQNRGTPTYVVYAFGTFDGCTVNLQVSPDGTNWVTVYSFVSEGAKLVEGSFYAIRGSVETAGAITNVSLVVD
jgi:hypothetical protein